MTNIKSGLLKLAQQQKSSHISVTAAFRGD